MGNNALPDPSVIAGSFKTAGEKHFPVHFIHKYKNGNIIGRQKLPKGGCVRLHSVGGTYDQHGRIKD